MKTALFQITALAAAISAVNGQACAPGVAKKIDGNWYCEAVKAITYDNFGISGSYNRVVSMDDGVCKSEKFEYSGPLAPLDEEVSWHFRGPLHLKQFAYYTPSEDPEKQSPEAPTIDRRTLHIHKRHKMNLAQWGKRNAEKRAIGDIVTATINGKVVSWTHGDDGKAAPTQPANPYPNQRIAPADTDRKAHPKSNPKPSHQSSHWFRQGYYSATSQTLSGLTFLNNHGGLDSGVFDTHLGMSLSYASRSGGSSSSGPQTLADTLLGDGDEVILMTDQPCTPSAPCPPHRPGTVAYHAFSPGTKLFLVEFSMPLTQARGFNKDMPALWILNAQIPRAAQYGPKECSCWASGCGEWDVFEVLTSGSTKAKSTLHFGEGNVQGGGSSDFFERPTGEKTVKLAVLFDQAEGRGRIVVLDDGEDVDFGEGLEGEVVKKLLKGEGEGEGDGRKGSTFRLPG